MEDYCKNLNDFEELDDIHIENRSSESRNKIYSKSDRKRKYENDHENNSLYPLKSHIKNSHSLISNHINKNNKQWLNLSKDDMAYIKIANLHMSEYEDSNGSIIRDPISGNSSTVSKLSSSISRHSSIEIDETIFDRDISIRDMSISNKVLNPYDTTAESVSSSPIHSQNGIDNNSKSDSSLGSAYSFL